MKRGNAAVDKSSLSSLLQMPTASVQTPLQGDSFELGQHRIGEQAMKGKINLRGQHGSPAFAAAIEAALRTRRPETANTIMPFLGGLIFWLGPDEWLVHCELGETDKHIQALRTAFNKEPQLAQASAVTDVSDYSSCIDISGPQARQLIASACPFDTRPEHFKPGQCAQTRFGHASVLLWPIKLDHYGLQVRWSYARYVFDYLVQSTKYNEALKALD